MTHANLPKVKATAKQKKAMVRLRKFALSLPEAWEDHPWGENVVKVKKKVFVFLGREDGAGGIGFSVKLPESADDALSLDYTEPTGYGLGKSGWVSVHLPKSPDVELYESWIEESYRSVAPKKLAAKLDDE